MVVIRLRRAGSKKRPFFRVVATDSRFSRDGRFLEILGHYNPRTKPATVRVKQDRVDFWIQRGAQPSDSVRTLIARHLSPAPAVPEAKPKAAPVVPEAAPAVPESAPAVSEAAPAVSEAAPAVPAAAPAPEES